VQATQIFYCPHIMAFCQHQTYMKNLIFPSASHKNQDHIRHAYHGARGTIAIFVAF